MEKLPFIFSLIIVLMSCSTDPSAEEFPPKMVPDRTPYIAGLVEASPDTTHHYPEIVVGYFTDIFETDKSFSPDKLLNSYPGIYSPSLVNQLVKTSIAFGLEFEPEPSAKVTVRGPVNRVGEQEVSFTHEGNGVYGDQNFGLPRIAEGRYELRVELPDGRVYSGRTTIPEAVDMSLPDSISVDVKYEPFGDGTPKEEDIKPYPIVYKNPEGHFLTIKQYNSDKDRESLLLEPDEGFTYTDRSNYLRTGIGYAISIPRNVQQDTLPRYWSQNLEKPKEEIFLEKHWWLRFSFFSEGVSKMYFPLVDFFASNDSFNNELLYPRLDAGLQNDSTYLFDVSTIRKVGPGEKILPKEESDAIGFFGGYFSLYRQTTLYPIRNFDLDSVLTANGQE